MIIFYDKTTGNITGTIDGLTHTNDQSKMWIGDKSTTKRLVFDVELEELPELVMDLREKRARTGELYVDVKKKTLKRRTSND